MKSWLRLSLVLGLAIQAGADAREVDAQDVDMTPNLDRSRQGRATMVVGGTGRRGAVPDVYTVRRGDTLWDVTGRYFGNPYHWPRIWSYNPEITNPHWIYPLDRIRLRRNGEDASEIPTSVRAPRRAQQGTVWLRQLGFLDEDDYEESGLIIGSPEEQMLLSVYDEIYVRFEEGANVVRGSEYTIYRELEEDEREPEEQGNLVRIFGSIQIRSYDEDRNIGRATITESLDPIERGFRVAPIRRRFDMVPPRENAIDLEAEVVASLRPLRIHGDHQLVFVNVGEEQDVQLGNRFFVIRNGDTWRQNLQSDGLEYGEIYPDAAEPNSDDYPTEVVAEGRVVDLREGTATLLITRSVTEIEVGDRVEMREGF